MIEDSLYDDMFSGVLYYPHECIVCKHWWMGGAAIKCPECGSNLIGVAGCPPNTLAVDDEEPE